MKKYCIMPFASVRIEDGKNKNSTQFRPCCYLTPEKEESFNSLDEYFNSNMLRDLQQHLLTQDTLPSSCAVCQQVEDIGQLSLRQLKNQSIDVEYLTQTTIQELDIFPSNVCNLSCIMCSPKFSSAVGAEQKQMGIITQVFNFDETDRVCDAIKSLPDLKNIGIAGGEFFYAKHCTHILKTILQHGVKNLRIISNGTVFNPIQVEILKQIPNVEIQFSVDGTGDHYEFVRYPAKWNQVQQNILNYQKSLPTARILLIMIMQPLTIFTVFDWLTFARTNNFETHWLTLLGVDYNWSMLTQPEKDIVGDFIQHGINTNKLTTHQKLYLLNYNKNTIQKTQFDQDVRLAAIKKISKLCNHRNIPVSVVKSLITPWVDLQQEIINYETSNYNNPR